MRLKIKMAILKGFFAAAVTPFFTCSSAFAAEMQPSQPWRNIESDPVWQWSVPAPTIPGRRAFLWIPPQCNHVRGIVIGLQNMLEKPLFERCAFRAACAADDLAIVLICSGHDRMPGDEKRTVVRSYLDIFLNPDFPKGGENPKLAGEDLQRLLDRLAEESGYPEIAQAPLMPVVHSSAGSFVWHLYEWDPGRIFAMMPFKTGLQPAQAKP